MSHPIFKMSSSASELVTAWTSLTRTAKVLSFPTAAEIEGREDELDASSAIAALSDPERIDWEEIKREFGL